MPLSENIAESRIASGSCAALAEAASVQGRHSIPKAPKLTQRSAGDFEIVAAEVRDNQWAGYCRSLAVALSFILHVSAAYLLAKTLCPAHHERTIAQPITAGWLVEEAEVELALEAAETKLITIVEPAGLPLVMSSVEDTAHVPDPPDIPAPLPGDPAPPSTSPRSTHAEISSIAPFAPLRLRKSAGGGYAGRHAEAKARFVGDRGSSRPLLVLERGGSEKSEDAVERGLQWLAAHQMADGSWRFEHGQCGCTECLNPGYATTTTGATGLSLLPFLGAGHTHERGEYQAVVANGINFLLGAGRKSSRGLDLQDGTMYAQGIAAIALCEAYAMTDDPALKEPAQGAIDFIIAAQHAEGGWRYYPNQPGDMTVLGWQLMALQSARLAELNVPEESLIKAAEFLLKVEGREGGGFGYQEPGAQPAPTAIGVLSSMYLGRERTDSSLVAGIERLANWGPAKNDVYFNYYATQVMHHVGGSHWETWNGKLRDQLIDSQSLDGHSKGSWFFAEKHAYAGGRLYTTSMATMILEIYYRHLPLYAETPE